MTFQVHDLKQGSPEWHALRLSHRTASEAPVMMGDSDKGKRNELLALKKTGIAKEVSRYVQEKVFDPGHEAEAAQRLLMEGVLGEALYPTTATLVHDGLPLLASVDGITMDYSVIFEHKGWNEELAAMVRSGELSAEYYWQLEQQILVYGAERALFVVSDGTAENREILDYYPVPGRVEQLMAGWHQFDTDLATFEVSAPVEKIEARAIENLPALVIKLSGGVAQSNLEEYRAGALAFIAQIKTELVTDQDFADAEATVKFCEGAEKKIKEVKAAALNDTASIAEAFKVMDELGAAVREKRLILSKLVTSQKEARKTEIRVKAEDAFREHVAAINKEIGPRVRLPEIECDIAGEMSGKRNLDSLQNAADTVLSKAKIKANELAAIIRGNLAVLRELPENRRGLFNDAQEIILKPAEDFANLVAVRVKAAEDAEAEAERQRLENEERIREEARKQALEDAEKERLAKEAEAAKPADEPVTPPAPAEEISPQPEVNPQPEEAHAASSGGRRVAPAPAPKVSTKPKIVPRLVSLENLIVAVLDGVVPEDLLQVNQEALERYIAEKGYVPPGFTSEVAQ